MVAKLIDRTVEIGQAWPCPVRVYFVPDAESWKVLQQKYEGLRDYTGDSLGSACRWACENVTHVAVTIGDASKLSSFEVVGLIVHEATHVWQYIQEAMGETTPGNEQCVDNGIPDDSTVGCLSGYATMSDQQAAFEYQCVDSVVEAFHKSTAKVKGIRSARGTGKSVALQAELFGQAIRMPPQKDGIRRSRYCIVRSTYREIEGSLLNTHRYLFAHMKVLGHKISGREPWVITMDFPLADGTRVNTEWVMMAVNNESLHTLRSREFTAAAIGEAFTDHDDLQVFTALLASCGRYPSKRDFTQEWVDKCEKDGKELYWSGLLFDSNGPHSEHPARQVEDSPPEGWEFYVQEAPVLEIPEDEYKGTDSRVVRKFGNVYVPNPACQYHHIHSAKANYWLDLIPGADRAALDSSILGRYSVFVGGKPCYSSWKEDCVLRANLTHSDTHRWPLVIGCDTSGVNGAAVVTAMVDGTLYVIDEIQATDVSFEMFLEDYLTPLIQTRYPTNRIVIVCDPSNTPSGLTKMTALQVLLKNGYNAVLARTNNIRDRLNSVMGYIDRRNGLRVLGTCTSLLRGFRGEYKYAPVRGKPGVYKPTPDKTHGELGIPDLHDALQYACLYHKGLSMNSSASPIQLKPRVRRIA